ncbi:MAG: flavodoxin family protein [Candidatus Omnitrophica bacterium]|jgi:multimeric flavodoxin WrbA|nr:flavodoxin family protein [Candidatus Omnitrophota bacterium]MDD5078386.1 flavodoxin family protein [Candidatus Omnitrophota bacterium]
MKVIAFNGSPRKEWNTATLLKKALEGAASQGAQTEFVQLYELDYQGCISCFACKEKGGESYGRCVVQDDLKPVFDRIEKADALIFGSPIYLGNITGQTQSFLERLLFPYLAYTDPPESLFPKKIPTGFIYTMGMTEELMNQFGYRQRFAGMEGSLSRIFGSSETLLSFDTCQFEDYAKMVAPRFDPAEKLKRRREVFPEDCRKAIGMGIRLAGGKQD